ncbi:MAG: PspC domain-containing protein [Cyclobacteriaceae bacterium]|nr:PspC domain-containing protein [Cyclobacteriaceae bacterium]
MKKNISINISGIIFHIEEDGYDTLRKYLDSVNKYFASFDDNSEILSDIESRIAEIFLSKLNDGKQVITSEDVSSLISTMGSVSDFKAAEETEFAAGEPARETKQQSSSSTTSAPRKLFRDQNRKILGGVCAGLGHYFSVDPVWPRLLFALLVVGTSGIFLLVYIVLWIVLPISHFEDEASIKKMYRDPDKKVVGGVAAGVAAFFSADIAIIRLLFVIAAIFGGVGIVLYIVLWIVLPEAKTITEKMKMQGEPVTLSNIESTVKKGLNEKESDESILARIILFPFRAIALVLNALGKVLGPVLSLLIDILRVAIGLSISFTGLLLILCLLMAFGILIGLFHAPDWNFFSDWGGNTPNLPLAAIRNSFPTFSLIFGFLATFIPALFLMLIGNSIIAKRLVFRAAVGWSLFVVFFVSLAVVSFSVPQIIYGFKEKGEFREELTFNIQGKTPVFNINETGMDDYNGTSLSFKGYDGKEIKLIERFKSQGASRKIAMENAQMVEYHVAQTDSIIAFDSDVTFKKDSKFRVQQLDIDVMIPYNQPFVVDAKLWRMINTDIVDVRDYDFSLNEDTQTWKMTDKGLECTSCSIAVTDRTNKASDQFGYSDFNSLDLKGILNVRIEKGENYAVELKGPESEKRRYEIYTNGGTLVVDYDNHSKVFWKKNSQSDNEMRIIITMPELHDIRMQGAGKLKFKGFDENEVDIQLNGAIVGEGDLNAVTLNVDLNGASSLELSGSGKFLEADIAGVSGLRAFGYEVKHCIVEAHGASTAKVNVTERLEIKEGIVSSVTHRGNPEIIKN